MKKENQYHSMLDNLYEGHTTKQENQELNFLSSAELMRNMEEYSKQKWDECNDEIDPAQAARMRDSILCQIATSDSHKSSQSRHQWSVLIRVAAVLAIVFVSAIGGIHYNESIHAVQTYELFADRGQKSSLTLPDGSRVWLNSDSRITYSSDFNLRNRNITLDGQAYFEVTKNQELPFTVSANEMEITALGTKFDVMAYTDEDEIIATLVEGKIKTCAGNKEKIITPNNQSCYHRSSGALSVKSVAYSDHLIPWRNNELVFSDETLGEISKLLERMYNVEIVFSDDSVMDFKYNGLVRNNSLHNVLYLISSSSPVNYQMYGNTIKFTLRK